MMSSLMSFAPSSSNARFFIFSYSSKLMSSMSVFISLNCPSPPEYSSLSSAKKIRFSFSSNSFSLKNSSTTIGASVIFTRSSIRFVKSVNLFFKRPMLKELSAKPCLNVESLCKSATMSN